ncbi:MAG: DLW-39 family protein [Bifidobacteriaceae bacterium]|jgi:hypothetical protein|nr:DLW-39 family protein [Bifidobacteriaceae bacterium]
MKKLIVLLLALAGGYWAYRLWTDSQHDASIWDEVTDTVA